ncbi:PTS sugar transporter subunit IIA [uncultured Anaerococcus sp.]|uniref:PTS sugar transporter subunit IIA n=1 Tax=uncultured Anaerococcus sp. TaxID=293428 RepID=UPI00261FA86F|nr:PTS sugar transporter subunit IIA [uncultured Anaerococcus sp.]
MIDKDMIFLDADFNTKGEIFNYIADAAVDKSLINSKDEFISGLYFREGLMSTSLDFNIAIPHVKSSAIESDFISYMKLKKDIIWNEDDDQPTNQIFMIAVTEGGSNRHLQYIAEISRNLIDEDFRNRLRNANTKKEIYKILNCVNMEGK